MLNRAKLLTRLAANYEEMFTALLTQHPDLKPRITSEIAWAKRVLKKSDRIIWWLRWVKLAALYDAEPERAEKEMRAYNAKGGTSYSDRNIDTLSELYRNHEDLEHYFGTPYSKIQDYHPGYLDPFSVHSQLKDLEVEYQERANKLLTPQNGDRIIIQMPDGTAWWELSRGYCDAEARAMGHCGNGGSDNSDNEIILSYRSPVKDEGEIKWEPHLTFILDQHGFIGEMKGKANNKPEARYHKAIEKLLLSNYVVAIKGGGYKPENNFEMSDLPEKEKKRIEEEKPSLRPLKEQFDENGVTPDVQERVEVLLSGTYKSPQIRWNADEELFEAISRVWDSRRLLMFFSDQKTSDFAHKAYDEDFMAKAVTYSDIHVTWQDLVRKLPKVDLSELQDMVESDVDEENLDTWEKEGSNVTLDTPERVISLLTWWDYTELIDLLKKATLRGCIVEGQKQIERPLRYAIERCIYRPYDKEEKDFWQIQWVATLTPQQAVDMATTNPDHGLEEFTQAFSDGHTEEQEIHLRPDEMVMPYDTMDLPEAFDAFHRGFAPMYLRVRENRRSREQHARSQKHVAASTPKVITREQAVTIRHAINIKGKHKERTENLAGFYEGMPEGNYVLVDIPLSRCDHFEQDADREQFYAGAPGDLPPVYVRFRPRRLPPEETEVAVLDGNHRCRAAEMRGQSTVKAIMPEEDYEKFRSSAAPKTAKADLPAVPPNFPEIVADIYYNVDQQDLYRFCTVITNGQRMPQSYFTHLEENMKQLMHDNPERAATILHQVQQFPAVRKSPSSVGAPKPESKSMVSRQKRGAITPSTKQYWHGTALKFDQLEPNEYGIIWAGDRRTARDYAESDESFRQVTDPSARKRMISVQLKPGAKIMDLRDKQDPIVQDFYTRAKDQEDTSHRQLEGRNPWALPFLREQGVDAVLVTDDAKNRYGAHLSLGIINPDAIKGRKQASGEASLHAVNFDTLPKETIGDICYMLLESLPFLSQSNYNEDDLRVNLAEVVDQPQVLVGQLPTAQVYATYNRSPSDKAVAKYQQMLEKPGFEFDPILVLNGKFFDGGHRMEAYHRAGRKMIPVVEVANLMEASPESWEAWMSGEDVTAAQMFPVKRA